MVYMEKNSLKQKYSGFILMYFWLWIVYIFEIILYSKNEKSPYKWWFFYLRTSRIFSLVSIECLSISFNQDGFVFVFHFISSSILMSSCICATALSGFVT
jgi:hypothetical protein